MTSIITRSALEYWGKNPPPDLAYVTSDGHNRRIVTWGDVMEARRKRQAKILDLKRRTERWRAYKLWVCYFDMPLMGGWQAMIERGDKRDSSWIDRDWRWLKPMLMTFFPLVEPGDDWRTWDAWKAAFAARYERRQHDGHPVGVAYVWWNRRDSPRPVQAKITSLIALSANTICNDRCRPYGGNR